jgi:trehalose 6-phosphate synthase
LILSTLAGAACELTDALQVSPYNCGAMAQAFQQALTMPLEERQNRHALMLAALRRNDITAWHSRFIEQLRESARQ